jgi:hypothetical protein
MPEKAKFRVGKEIVTVWVDEDSHLYDSIVSFSVSDGTDTWTVSGELLRSEYTPISETAERYIEELDS